MHDGDAPLAKSPLLRAPLLGTWEFDLATQRVSWSASLEEIHGIPIGSFEGTFEAYQRDIHPEDRERVLATIERNIAARKGHALVYRIVRPDGALRWLDARGEFMTDTSSTNGSGRTRLVGVCADVTDQLAEDARRSFLADVTRTLASSLDVEKTLQTVARLAVPRIADWCAVDVFVDVADPARGLQRVAVAHADETKIALANEIARRFPINVDHPGYRAMFASKQPQLVPALTRELLVASGRSAEHIELTMQFGIVSLVVAPIDLRGVIVGMLSVATSESGRILTPDDVACIQELGAVTAVALENARLYREARAEARTREDVVGIVSHDLRTPLSVIALVASSLVRRDVDEKTTATARRIVASTERASRLVDDLVDFTMARTQGIPVAPTLVSLDELALTAIEELRAAHPERQIDLHPERLQGQWDPHRLLQVLTNLIGNALEHSPPTARVRVSLRGGSEAAIDVHNEGSAIPRELHERIFEPFSRGRGQERESRGLGLGLYIASQIVRAHRGRIELASEPGEGTTFTVYLPLT